VQWNWHVGTNPVADDDAPALGFAGRWSGGPAADCRAVAGVAAGVGDGRTVSVTCGRAAAVITAVTVTTDDDDDAITAGWEERPGGDDDDVSASGEEPPDDVALAAGDDVVGAAAGAADADGIASRPAHRCDDDVTDGRCLTDAGEPAADWLRDDDNVSDDDDDDVENADDDDF